MTRSATEATGEAARQPTTMVELIQFYYTFVKPLYSAVQLTNKLPVEVLFEINAAFDHLTRIWAYGEPEPDAVRKACSHLKRSCLDIFKIHVREARDQFDELRKIDTSIIDNGEFDRRLVELWHRIKARAQEARVREGDPRKDAAQAVYAFSLWMPVYEDCITLDKDFYNCPKVDWARKKHLRNRRRDWIIGGLCFGTVSSLIASAIWWAGAKATDRVTHPVPPNMAADPSQGQSTTQPLAAPASISPSLRLEAASDDAPGSRR